MNARGNILFLILAGVLLFAALSYAISTSGSGSISSMAVNEENRITANELIEYGNYLRTEIDSFITLNRYSDRNTAANGILFAATGADAAYGVVGAQSATEVFHASGGKLRYLTPSSKTCTGSCAYEFSGQYTITGVGSDSRSELVMLVIGLTESVCQRVNENLRLNWSTVPTGGALTLTRFNGNNYGNDGGANPITLTGGANEFTGKRAFCYRESGGSERYIYLHTLRVR